MYTLLLFCQISQMLEKHFMAIFLCISWQTFDLVTRLEHTHWFLSYRKKLHRFGIASFPQDNLSFTPTMEVLNVQCHQALIKYPSCKICKYISLYHICMSYTCLVLSQCLKVYSVQCIEICV